MDIDKVKGGFLYTDLITAALYAHSLRTSIQPFYELVLNMVKGSIWWEKCAPKAVLYLPCERLRVEHSLIEGDHIRHLRYVSH